MQQANKDQVLPVIFACCEKDKAYFEVLDRFLRRCLGDEVANYYEIITESPRKVAEAAKAGVQKTYRFRRKTQEAYGFNWQMQIPYALQKPFVPSHDNMGKLQLFSHLPPGELSVNLRAAFSGIVAGNVKPFGIEAVKKQGPYQLHADKEIAELLNGLLQGFVEQGRMSLAHGYKPCFEIKSQ